MLFLSDIFPTGYMAAENCQIKPGDTVAVWGCGPVGQFAIQSAFLLGAERVIAIDRFPERLALARDVQQGRGARLRRRSDVPDALREMTGGPRSRRVHRRGGPGGARHDARRAGTTARKTSLYLATDRPHALRQAIRAAARAGTVSIPGVYGGLLDKVPLGAAFAKGLTLKMGQTHVHRYMPRLLEHIERGDIDPVVHHHAPRRAGGRARDVPDVPREGGRVHQGRDDARGGGASSYAALKGSDVRRG